MKPSMAHSLSFVVCLCFLASPLSAEETANNPADKYPAYAAMKSELAKGWNTWNTRNVLSQVLLPEGYALNMAFKQHYWLDEKYLEEALIGRRGKDVEHIRPGPHRLDGRYSQLTLKWEQLHAQSETAVHEGDLLVLITLLEQPASPVKLVLDGAMLWNRPGSLAKQGHSLVTNLPSREIRTYTTGQHTPDPYVKTKTPYLSILLGEDLGISTGKARDLDSIRQLVAKARKAFEDEAAAFGALAEAYIAIQSGIAWNTIYEPKFDRVVSTVGRLWNEEYGGYCLFGWDNFFLAYMTSLFDKELAIVNTLEHLRGTTEEGFIPNDNQGNGRKSWDRSQPPVGGIMVREVYRRFPESWLLEAAFDPLLGWNRWWARKRVNEGLLGYGSHEAKNPFKETYLRSMRAAGYESGMDDSPMYSEVSFNREKNTMELQDVGLNSLYIADCKALLEMAILLGKDEERKELEARIAKFSKNMESLWHEPTGLYLNRDTAKNELSMRLSPTLFYPLLAGLPSRERAERILREHLLNPEEFWGDFVLPSIARNDRDFAKQRYWKGAIWPPLNFLTYLSLRNYGMAETRSALAQKSLDMFVSEWRRKGFVSENYSSITGTGDDDRLSSDRFHSWGALFGFMAFIEAGHLAPTETPITSKN